MKYILTIAKYITSVAVIGGAALWFEAKFDAGADNSQMVLDSIAELKEEVYYINVEQGFMAKDIMDIKDTTDDIKKELESHSESIDKLWWVRRNEDKFTKEQMELLLNDWLKKNNGLTVYDTPAPPG